MNFIAVGSAVLTVRLFDKKEIIARVLLYIVIHLFTYALTSILSY